jgi:pantetheine-phosphate adenylyltransferase
MSAPAMSRVALYPGSFDPFTNGHLDLLVRAAKIFEKVIVSVACNPEKRYLFSVAERLDHIGRSIKDACLNNVETDSFNGLLVDYAQRYGVKVIIRGLRVISDFEHELEMAMMNRKLNPSLEYVFMFTGEANLYISSTRVKEIARFGGCVEELVPPYVLEKLKERFRKERQKTS